jgi:nanoRNase/pAp phosphatase (c-di-AMP/oligoRNAs hydrolase)
VSFRSVEKGINVSEIAQSLGGGGHEAAAAAEIDDTLSGAEQKILDSVRQYWQRRNVEH